MKSRNRLLEALGIGLLSKAISFFFLAVGCVLALPFLLLYKYFQASWLMVLAGLIFFIGLLASVFTGRDVAYRLADNPGMSFTGALSHTLHHYLLLLCFVPIVGKLFTRFVEKPAYENPFIPGDKDREA
jgi:hypothetical protein